MMRRWHALRLRQARSGARFAVGLETAVRGVVGSARAWAAERPDVPAGAVLGAVLSDAEVAAMRREAGPEFRVAVTKLAGALADRDGTGVVYWLIALGHAGRTPEFRQLRRRWRQLGHKAGVQLGHKAGVHEARAPQRSGGADRAKQVRKVTPAMQKKLRGYHAKGKSISWIEKKLKLARSTVRRHLQKTGDS
jgi:hypothetical protein